MIRIADYARNRKGWQRFCLALAAGAGAGLALPPVDAWPLLFAAFPVLVWLIDGLPVRRPFVAFALGWAFGAGYFAVCLYWVGAAFFVDVGTYLWMMPFAVGALAGGMALYWGAAVLAVSYLWRPGLSRILMLAIALAIAEWLRGHLMTGFPWAAPGLASIGMGPVAQTASLVGMTSLTFWIVIWAALPALCFERRRSQVEVAVTILLAVTLPAALAWGTWRLAESSVSNVDGVSLRIVQPNIPQDEKWLAGSARTIFSTLIDLSSRKDAEGNRGFTHLIWPESAVPFYLEESEEARTIIGTLVGERGLLITGNLRREPGGQEPRVYNSVLGFDGAGNSVLRYDKWRLVPGGEFLPLAWLLEPLGFRKVVTVPGSFEAGSGPHSLPVPGAPEAGFLICYEVVFPDRLVDAGNRPGWLVNVTNDGWFGHTSGPYQHLAQARLRAIEQGLPIVRAANSGISAVIDPYGRILQSLTLGTPGIIDAPLPSPIAPPFYARLGDLLMVAEIIIAILLVAVLSFRDRRKR